MKPDIIAPDYFFRYINLVKEEDLSKALKKNTKQFLKLLKNIPKKKHDFAYEDGKWTIKQLLQHIIDSERVFAVRALWFARKDPNGQPGFDENIWGNNAVVENRKWNDLVKEFILLRLSTELLFKSFTNENLNTTGLANYNQVSVAALGFIVAGHVTHHMNVLKERYLSK